MIETKHGFELVRETEISEYKTKARLFRHHRTGAELLSLESDDDNKVFGITFRTPPQDSTGLPHILEHAVLSGSRKYPLKDPFAELSKGSLNTFLNAMTYPDRTIYPVASQNLQDFYNLIEVYLDSVFYPLLSPYSFQQEGWHHDLEKPEAPLSYKGIVFNEMKGVYSSPDALLAKKSQRQLFPDNIYSYDSGGDPEKIPDLTYEQFKAFHENYYHPSNARIYFYGDDDPEERLRILDGYLKDFEPRDVDSTISLQPRFGEPRRVVFPYDAGDSPDATKVLMTVNWLLAEGGDPELTLGLSILSHILVGTPASPLRKALIESGLGEDLTGRGLDTDLVQMLFSTGMKGVTPENVAKLEQLIYETLGRLAGDGLDPETVAASMNTVEFQLRENNTGSLPRGLVLLLRSLTAWLYGGDPIAPLAFEAPLESVKGRLQSGELYFENLVREYLLDNPHRTTVILEPDPELGMRREASEKERLALARDMMSAEELQAVADNTAELRRRQEAPDPPEARASIPTLKLGDLDREVKRIPLEVLEQEGRQVLYHDLFTNGILYLDVGFDLHSLPQELVPFIPIFGRALLEMGTETEDYVRLSQRIGRHTGGISPTLFTSAVGGGERSLAWIFLRGKATVSQTSDLLSILRDILVGVRLDNRDRFRQMVLEAKAEHESRLIPAGHAYVNRWLRAGFNQADYVAEQMTGVSQLFAMRALVEQIDRDWPKVLGYLRDLHDRLISRENVLLNATLDTDNWSQVRAQAGEFLGSLPTKPVDKIGWEIPHLSPYQGLTIPAQVNYVGKGANLYRLGYELDGSVLVIIPYLRGTWLWEKVRMQGGAYGAFGIFDRHSGVFTFVSYRDPNLVDTLSVYDQAGQFLRSLELNEDELTKAIIGAIGDMDAYQLPDAQGYTSMLRYLLGLTDEERQRMRDKVLSTTQEDFHAFGEVLERVKEDSRIAVLGHQEAISTANRTLPVTLDLIKVL